MTDIDDYADDLDDDYEPDPDDFWDDGPDPDPADYEESRAYAEHVQHCEDAHGGGDCNCRPSRLDVLRLTAGNAARRVRSAWTAVTWMPHILRLGPVVVAVRFRRPCGACSGRGWFHSKGGLNPVPAPPGYDGVALCGCGTAIDRLSDSRRYLKAESKRAPF